MMMLSKLNEREKLQIEYQLKQHSESKIYKFNPKIGPDDFLSKFVIFSNVLKPMSSLVLTQYLYSNPDIYHGKTVLDLGSGSGILGIIAAVRGASRVIFSDVSLDAYFNTVGNLHEICPEKNTTVVRGDLFENIEESVDVIIFAQPYFPDDPIEEFPVTLGMLDSGSLMQRFLNDAKKFVKGSIFMPFLDWISDPNNPKIQGIKNEYRVQEVLKEKLGSGIQQGIFSVYELFFEEV